MMKQCMKFFLICFAFLVSMFYRKKRCSAPRRIFILASGYLGDTFWAVQTLGLLKKAYPEAELFIGGRPFIRELCYGLIPEENQKVIRSVVSDRMRENVSFSGIFAESRKIRDEVKPDLLIDLVCNRYSALFALRSGAYTVGLDIADEFYPFYSFCAKQSLIPSVHLAYRPRSIVMQFLSMEETAGLKLLPPVPRYSKEEILKKLSLKEEEKLIMLIPGAGWEAKRWHIDHFRKLGELLSEKGYRIIFSGAGNEKDLCLQASCGIKEAVILCDELSDTISLLPHCKAVIGNDSGVVHLAAAFGVKVYTLFCQTNPEFCGALGEKSKYIKADCFHIPQKKEHFCCASKSPVCRYGKQMNITVQQVLSVLSEDLGENCTGLKIHSECKKCDFIQAEKRPLKVLVPISCAELGGSQVFLLKLLDASKQDPEIIFEVLLFQDGPLYEEFKKRGINCKVMTYSMRCFWTLLPVIKEIRKMDPDVIYLHAGRLFAGIAKLLHIPCVERINMSRVAAVGGWCSTPWIDRFCTSLNTKALAVSSAIARQLFERNIPEEKIIVIRNFVEVERFHHPERKMSARRELNIPEDKILIINVGRFTPQKAQCDFISVAAKALKKNPDLLFLLIGDGPLKQDLLKQAEEAGIKDNIHFAPFRRDVEKLYHAADLMLHTAHWAPLDNVLLEAMAAELPVVASDVDGTNEVIHHGSTGLLFPARDTDKAADLLLKVIENKEYAAMLGRNAYLLVEENHSIPQVTMQFKQMFNELAGRRV